jgi:hypothetical protein
VVNGHVIRQKSIPLGPITTAYQATLTAILRGAEALVPYAQEGKITLFCSQQSAILALNNPILKSKLTLATHAELDNLALVSNHPVKLAWARPKPGCSGIGTASTLAKQGARTVTDPEAVDVPVCKSQIKQDIKNEVDRRWCRRWSKTTTARHTRLLWPTINNLRSCQLLLCNREEFAVWVRMLTGHNNLNKHSALCKEVESAQCRFCLNEEETAIHLLTDCPTFESARLRLFGSTPTEINQLSQMPLSSLRCIIQLVCRKLFEQGLEKV